MAIGIAFHDGHTLYSRKFLKDIQIVFEMVRKNSKSIEMMIHISRGSFRGAPIDQYRWS